MNKESIILSFVQPTPARVIVGVTKNYLPEWDNQKEYGYSFIPIFSSLYSQIIIITIT